MFEGSGLAQASAFSNSTTQTQGLAFQEPLPLIDSQSTSKSSRSDKVSAEIGMPRPLLSDLVDAFCFQPAARNVLELLHAHGHFR